MRFRRGRFSRSRGRRTVAWIPGFSGFDTTVPTNQRTVTLSANPVAATTWEAAIALVTPTDLSLHGGEDAVLTRIRGQIMCLNGRVNAGAGFAAATFPLRLVVALAASDASGVFAVDYTTAAGLGRDEILYTRELWCTQSTLVDSQPSSFALEYTEVDVKAKRRMQESALVVLWFQTVLPIGTTAADFRLIGGLRSLLMRPR